MELTMTKEEKKKKKPMIVIDSERCKGCYLCVRFCKAENIRESKKLNSKGYHPAETNGDNKCVGCELCMLVCPDLAIEVYDEE